MNDIIFWALIAVGIVVGALVLIALCGLMLPTGHQVTRSITLKQPIDAVWQTITDFADMPSWHKDVVQVERQPDKNGHEVWKETQKGNYGLILETTELTPPTRLVRTIADEDGPFSGRWEFDLTPVDGGCQVSITEVGAIRNPFFRVMFRLFMKPETYLVIYLQALAAKYGERAS